MSSSRFAHIGRVAIAVTVTLIAMSFSLEARQVGRPQESEPQHPQFDPAQVTAGRQTFLANCSFCHGATARGGGQGGPDLTQSAIVRADHGGNQLGAFLKVGRPDKGMPAFNLSEDKVTAIAAFLHSTIASTARHPSFGTEVLVGDAAAGKAFFEGAGKCVTCHSARGDLKGIGSKYPPAVLQGRMVLPIGDGGYPGFVPKEPLRIRVTISQANGEARSGLLVSLSDYTATFLDASGVRQTLARHGDDPKIETEDPLQAHIDRQFTLTDKQMHDLTAYLATLK
ncbi:MAG: c-type cytochrome [Acidobacteriaceae bacterium]|nr:c-type cytochrome [Acidobacteriaceae bacterium]